MLGEDATDTIISDENFIRYFVYSNTGLRKGRRGFIDVSAFMTDPRVYGGIVAVMHGEIQSYIDDKDIEPRRSVRIAAVQGNGNILAAMTAVWNGSRLPMIPVKEQYEMAPRPQDPDDKILAVGYDNHLRKKRTVEIRKSDLEVAGGGYVPAVFIIDDLLRSGAKALAVKEVIEKAGAVVAGVKVLVAMEDTGGIEALEKAKIPLSFRYRMSLERLRKGEYSGTPAVPDGEDEDFGL